MEPQHGRLVGRDDASDPLLPVVHAIAARVRSQTELLRPGVGKNGNRRLKFIRTDVHRAANNAGAAIQITCSCNKRIIAGIDAG